MRCGPRAPTGTGTGSPRATPRHTEVPPAYGVRRLGETPRRGRLAPGAGRRRRRPPYCCRHCHRATTAPPRPGPAARSVHATRTHLALTGGAAARIVRTGSCRLRGAGPAAGGSRRRAQEMLVGRGRIELPQPKARVLQFPRRRPPAFAESVSTHETAVCSAPASADVRPDCYRRCCPVRLPERHLVDRLLGADGLDLLAAEDRPADELGDLRVGPTQPPGR